MKINESSNFTLDLKTIILMVGGIISLSATYFTLMAEVEVAKTLPEIRASILSTQEDVQEIKEDMKYLRNKIDKIN